MPTIYKRNCDNCHEYYEGRGEKYCSPTCAYDAARLRENIISNSIVPSLDFNISITEDDLYEETLPRKIREDIFTYFNDGKRWLIVAISDLEFPYHDSKAITTALQVGMAEAEARSIEPGRVILLLAGDINHHYACSPFLIKHNIPLEAEKELSIKLVEYARNAGYGHVVMISGNHDRRLSKLMPKVLAQYPALKGQIHEDMLLDIEQQYEGYVIYARGWWVQIGSIIFAHPDRYCSTKNNLLVNSKNTVDYFLYRGHDFQAVVQGHSHIMGMGKYCRKTIIETGCMCKQIDYNVSGKQSNPTWEQAFAVLTLEGYDFLWNESRLYEIGPIGLNNNVARLKGEGN